MKNKLIKVGLICMTLGSISAYAVPSLYLNFTEPNKPVDSQVMNYYQVKGFAGDEIESKINNLSADVDLYVKVGSKPTLNTYDCRPYHSKTRDEACISKLQKDATIYIGVNGFKAGNYDVTATLKSTKVKTIGYNQEVFGISPKKKYRHYKIHANAGDILKIRAYNLDADGDLFAKVGSKASWDNFDKKSNYKKLKDEELTIEIDDDTDVYLSLYASENCWRTVKHKIKVTRTNAIEEITVLNSGETDGGSVALHKLKHYKIHASAGDTIKGILDGLDADADLFMKIGQKAGNHTFDCKSQNGGTKTDSCEITLNEDADVYIAVHGYKATDFNIMADVKKESKLLFKSGFENGVYLDEPTRRKDENSNSESSNTWWQRLKGSDTADFSWPIKLQGKKGQFQMIVDSDDVNRYIENEIIEMQGINNENSQVLHQIIKEKENDWTQDPYVVHINKEQKKLYIRYSLKFSKNLKRKLGKDGWLTFFEFKTTADYRVAIYVYEDKNSKLYWYAHGDNVVLNDKPYDEFWFEENKDIDVPTDQWFDVEIFWNRSTSNNGHVWMAIDGQKVIDYRGSTKIKDNIHQIMLFTNYSNAPIEQWVDNVEIWSDFPCGKGKSCH